MKSLATIGYALGTPATLIAALQEAKIDLLVDVRAIPNSRRPGFSKRALAAATARAGIDYLHLRGLGTPAEGRIAARAGRLDEMHAIFRKHLRTFEAQQDLHTLLELIGSGRSACLLCLEALAKDCHRSLVAQAAREQMRLRIRDLFLDVRPR